MTQVRIASRSRNNARPRAVCFPKAGNRSNSDLCMWLRLARCKKQARKWSVNMRTLHHDSLSILDCHFGRVNFTHDLLPEITYATNIQHVTSKCECEWLPCQLWWYPDELLQLLQLEEDTTIYATTSRHVSKNVAVNVCMSINLPLCWWLRGSTQVWLVPSEER